MGARMTQEQLEELMKKGHKGREHIQANQDSFAGIQRGKARCKDNYAG
jgi:hypothetical protein